MGTVRDLLKTRGHGGALEAGFEYPIVEAAATYLSNEDYLPCAVPVFGRNQLAFW
jgi:hypothetical protein